MEKNVKKQYKSGFDYTMFVIIIFLIAFGLVMLYSASSYTAQMEQNGDSLYYLNKQIKNLVFAGFAFTFMLIMDYHRWYKYGGWWLIGSIAVLFLIFIIPASEKNGAVRWVRIAGFTFQPSEISKVGIIIFTSILICKLGKTIRNWKSILVIMIPACVLAVLILFLNDNMSTALIVVAIVFVMTYVAYPRDKFFLGVVLLVLIGYFGLMYMADNGMLSTDSGDFRLKRIVVWRNPEAFIDDTGYQVVQGLYAIGSGGLFGKGLGNSIQKLGFMPEAQNDMIFAIICEELGLFGAVCVMLIYLVLIWRFAIIASNAPDMFGGMLVVGVMAHIAIQVLLNIAVVTGVVPNTGVTLPFISYGGSSLVFLMAEMGLVLNVSRQIKFKIE